MKPAFKAYTPVNKNSLMSQESFQLALGKAILDAAFRQVLFADPEQALAGFQLTAAEKNSLRQVDSEALELMAKILGRSLPVSKQSHKRHTEHHIAPIPAQRENP